MPDKKNDKVEHKPVASDPGAWTRQVAEAVRQDNEKGKEEVPVFAPGKGPNGATVEREVTVIDLVGGESATLLFMSDGTVRWKA